MIINNVSFHKNFYIFKKTVLSIFFFLRINNNDDYAYELHEVNADLKVSSCLREMFQSTKRG